LALQNFTDIIYCFLTMEQYEIWQGGKNDASIEGTEGRI